MTNPIYAASLWPRDTPVLIVLEAFPTIGDTTTCQLLTFPAGKGEFPVHCSVGKAHRNPDDAPNWRIGAKISRNRALREALGYWEQQGELEKDTWTRLFSPVRRRYRIYSVTREGIVRRLSYNGRSHQDHIVCVLSGSQPGLPGLRLSQLVKHALAEGATLIVYKRFRTCVSLWIEEGRVVIAASRPKLTDPDDFDVKLWSVEEKDGTDQFLRAYQEL